MAGSKTKAKQTEEMEAPVLHLEEMRAWASLLNELMISQVIDESKSTFGGEPVMKNLFDEGETYRLKGKLFHLLAWIDKDTSLTG
jgi:hypothetical protein